MLGNCEKMNQVDEKSLMDSEPKIMEKPNIQDQQQQQQQQPPLKCPRCDSSSTKFCYYNNYSLSQPRHFCKACKRYWTRGGTLRNVPVGGGCRRNKRVKRPVSTNEATSSSAQTTTSNPTCINVNPSSQIDLSSSIPNHVINPLFYSLLSNHHPSELNLPYPRFNPRASSMDSLNGYHDLQPQMNGLGLGFSSGFMENDVHSNYYIDGFNSNKQIQDVIPSTSLLSSYNPIFGSTSTSTSTMASLIASSLQQQKIAFGGLKDAQGGNNLQGFEQFEDMQMPRNCEDSLIVKDVKMEESQNRSDWNAANSHNRIEQINSSDPSLSWNTNGFGAWLDPSNVGSSVPSLI